MVGSAIVGGGFCYSWWWVLLKLVMGSAIISVGSAIVGGGSAIVGGGFCYSW